MTYDYSKIFNKAKIDPDDVISIYGVETVKTGDEDCEFRINMEDMDPDYGDYNYVISLNGTPLTGANVGFDETEETVGCSFDVPNCREYPDMEDGLEITIEKVYLASIYAGDYDLPSNCITASGTSNLRKSASPDCSTGNRVS